MMVYLIRSFFYFIFYPLWYIINRNNFRDRVSFRNLHCNDCIWIHAANIGEVNAIKPLVKRLLEQHNSKAFLMTSSCKVGVTAAKAISGKLIVHYFPLDLPHLIRRFFKLIRPRLIFLVESDFCMTLLSQAYKRDVPVVLLNARLSKRKFKKYRFFKWFYRKQFSAIKSVCALSVKDEEFFKLLKFQKVINANNLKFSMELPKHEMHILRHSWNFKFNDFIIAFGCTRNGEEALIKNIYNRLVSVIPRLKIIIAPRHLHRIPEITGLFKSEEYSLFSSTDTSKPFLIVDEIGILPQMYALSDIALIGGSFSNFGGHNPLEAVWYEKAVIIGEYHQSCIGAVEKLSSEQGIIISNEKRLFDDIMLLYNDIDHRKELGRKAKKILLDNQDAMNLHWEEIIRWI